MTQKYRFLGNWKWMWLYYIERDRTIPLQKKIGFSNEYKREREKEEGHN